MARKNRSKGIDAAQKALDGLRCRIDTIDETMVGLLDERARLAVETADLKKSLGQAVFQPAREAVIVERALRRRRVFPEASLAAIYREIIGASLSLEDRFIVSLLGPEATYTHLAATRHFGRSAAMRFETSIADVFLRVEKGEAEVGVVPIENSTEGAVVHTLDNLVESPLAIATEILLPIRHNLMVHPKTASRGGRPVLKRILSHPQALAQCRNFLEAHYPGIEIKAAASTSAAAAEAAKKPGIAAIASELAVERYGLKPLHRGIEDLAGNTTRFLVIRREEEVASNPTGRDKTSIAFSMKDRPGALFKMLEPFKRHRINLTKIESRPSRVRGWLYTFFIDMEGHSSEPRIGKALAELERECRFYRVLGSYPLAKNR
jgi:chorismate mutase/prephenate dehydratase